MCHAVKTQFSSRSQKAVHAQMHETLQNKVQWDIRFYFAQLANENIDKFNKGIFQLKCYANSILCL